MVRGGGIELLNMKKPWLSILHKHKSLLVKIFVSILVIGFSYRVLYSQQSVPVPVPVPVPVHVDVAVDDVVVDDVAVDDVSPTGFSVSDPTDDISAAEVDDDIPQSGGECNLFKGEWIPNPSGPIYTNETCHVIEDHQNCIKNGRPDSGYLYWRWNPQGCELPRFDAEAFLKSMRNKHWALIGDSISRNHVQSLLCMLSTAEKAVEVYHDAEYKSRRWNFPSYNLTVSVIWSPFLVKADIFEDINGVSSSEVELRLDKLDTWTSQFHSFDYIIISSGKWFIKSAIYYENDTELGCHYCSGKNNLTELGFDFAYTRALSSTFNYIISSSHKASIFFRTSTPDHFENGEWFSGGNCERKEPAKEGEFGLKEVNRILRKIEIAEFRKAYAKASVSGVNLKLLDFSSLSLMRPGGHPGAYRHFYPFAKDKNATVIHDCLHWCLPGPMDSWNEVLMEMVVNN